MSSHGGARSGAGRKLGAISVERAELTKAAQAKAGDMLGVLAKIAQDEAAPSSARISAACAVLDRGFGKPSQAMELEIEAPGDAGRLHLDPAKLSTEALREVLGAMDAARAEAKALHS